MTGPIQGYLPLAASTSALDPACVVPASQIAGPITGPIQIFTGPASNNASLTPLLGQFVYSKDTGKLVVGQGTTRTVAQLPDVGGKEVHQIVFSDSTLGAGGLTGVQCGLDGVLYNVIEVHAVVSGGTIAEYILPQSVRDRVLYTITDARGTSAATPLLITLPEAHHDGQEVALRINTASGGTTVKIHLLNGGNSGLAVPPLFNAGTAIDAFQPSDSPVFNEPLFIQFIVSPYGGGSGVGVYNIIFTDIPAAKLTAWGGM